MATSIQERLKIGTVELNDAISFTIESLTFVAAQKKPIWANNADSDGETLVRESHYTNASFELKVRVEPQKSIHAALLKLGELTDAIQACEKVEGGQSLEWTPATTEDTYTLYALSGDISGVPIEVSGEEAGWLLGAPVVTIKLTCRPFLYSPERVVLSLTESAAEPLQVRYIKGIVGDVPAEARLIVKDTAGQDRRFAMWGRDVVTSESLPTLLLTAKSGLTGSGFSGESKTRTGAYLEEKVLRGTAVSQATTLCGTGRIENVGSYAIYLRVYSTSEASRFRISYRSGDGPLRPLEWKQAPIVNGWSELYMGMASLDAVTLGTQTGEIRVEQKAKEGAAPNDINYLMLWPTKVSGKARGIAVNTPTNLIAYDNFEQSAGNLEGKTLPTGGTWAEVGKTGENGFKVNESTHVVERAKVSDSAVNAGCYAWAGPTKSQSCRVSAVSITETAGASGKTRIGVLARGSSTESEKNWLGAFVIDVGTSGTFYSIRLAVIKRVVGTETVLGETPTEVFISGSSLPLANCVLSVDASGNWDASLEIAGRTISLSGADTALAASGSLAEGKVGIYDAWTSGSSNTRTLDGFEALGSDPAGRTCFSGKAIEFNSQGCLRQDSTGTYDGPPSSYRGAGFYLEPEGKLGLINRVAIRMRRNDNEVEEDTIVSDKHSIEIKVRERYLVPR